MKNSQHGYSLVELSIVLAIIAVVIAGSVTGAQSILRSNNINKTISETNKAVTSIYSKYLRDADYSGVSLEALTGGGNEVWPTSQVASAGTTGAVVTNSLGGKVYVNALTTAYSTIAANGAFVYTVGNLPVAACVDLALGIESLGAVVTVKNNNTTAQTSGSKEVVSTEVVKDLGGNVSVSKVSKNCGSSGTASISLYVLR